jgi:hypothetical protein
MHRKTRFPDEKKSPTKTVGDFFMIRNDCNGLAYHQQMVWSAV